MIDSRSYPNFVGLQHNVVQMNPLQKRAILKFVDDQDEVYWKTGERISIAINRIAKDSSVLSYTKLCADLIKEQSLYNKTKSYRLKNQNDANDTVYSQRTMRQYVIGLLMSYLFWPNHYKMLEFYWECLPDNPKHVLDVGAGHGLFSAEMLRHSSDSYLDIVDISDESLTLTNEMLSHMGVYPAKVSFRKGDFLKESLSEKGYDFIILGEIVEHVDDPMSFLLKAKSLLTCEGVIFLSTCANCPAPDHIYQFHSVDEIRDLIHKTGMVIERDLSLPTDSTTINYCAKLSLGKLT